MRSDISPKLTLAIVVAVLCGHALSIQVVAHKGYFYSDEATYHSMAYSLAYDADIEYERHDLERIYRLEYGGGPTGLFLKRDPATDRLYYSKAFIYPLVAAPFVRSFGDNGFFVLHALLLAGLFAAGYAYLRRASDAGFAALYTATYLLASIAILYYFWMTPEWFNLSIIFFATFLWLYKLEPPGWPPGDAGGETRRFTGGRTDYAAAALYGVVTYSKPPNLLLIVPLVVWTAWRGHWKRAAALALVAGLAAGVLFGATWAVTGDWNYQGGDRKTFYGRYPYDLPGSTFDTHGSAMVTEAGDIWVPRPETFGMDLVYVLIGRNSGVLVYMFPAFLAALMYVTSRRRSWSSAHGLLLLGAAAQALLFLAAISGNWIGGGGTVGNRYFLSLYPLLFFVIVPSVGALGAVASWSIAAVFLAKILLNPFTSSHDPSLHTKTWPYTMLPTEVSLLNNLPFNTHPSARRVKLEEPATFLLYFLDDNTYLREPDERGFWVKGGRTAEIVLRSAEALDSLTLEVVNGRETNHVEATLGGAQFSQDFEPNDRATWRFTPGRHFFYEGAYLYRFSVRAERGFLPRFHNPLTGDLRMLGVLVRPSVEPAVPLR